MTGASWVYSDEKGCGGFAVKDREKCLGIFNLIPDRLRGFLRRCVIFAGTIGSGNFARIEERNRCFTSPCCFRRALFSLWRNLPRQGAQVYIYPYESAPYLDQTSACLHTFPSPPDPSIPSCILPPNFRCGKSHISAIHHVL